MKIKLTTIFVDDLDRALAFYTNVFGWTKKADFSNHGYRWLTVASPEDPNGVELQLELANDPAAKAFQQAMLTQGKPSLLVHSTEIKGDFAAMKKRGGKFKMEPTDVTASTIAQIEDGVGNLVQLVQSKY